jgi:hypothetical protein
MSVYPKILKNLEKLSAFFGISYGKEFEKILVREPDFTYMAYLSQSGTDAPLAQVLFSNFDNGPEYEYKGQGIYTMKHPLFKVNKTIVTSEPGSSYQVGYQFLTYPVQVDGEITMSVTSFDGTSNIDDGLLNSFIKVEVWL